MNVTPWFPGDATPVREGVYQRRACISETVLYAYWDSKGWRYGTMKRSDAPKIQAMSPTQGGMQWRGIEK